MDFERNVWNHHNVTYPNRWIDKGGLVPWPPELTPLWDSMNSMVYGTPVMSEEDLIARVHEAIESLTRKPHLLGHVCEAQYC